MQRWRQTLNNDRRLARLLLGGLSGFLGRGFGLVVSIITLPITVRYLGRMEYGIWVTISTSVIMLSVLDLGLANTLTNFISEAYAEDDRDKARRYFATAFWVSAGTVLLLAPVCWLAWSLANWGSIFHLNDPALLRQARDCVAVSAGFFLISLPLNLATKVLGGYQEVHIGNYFSMAGSALSLVAIVLTVELHGTIVALMAAYCFSILLGSMGMNMWLCLWRKPWLLPLPSAVRLGTAGMLFRQGILFFLLQLTGLVVFYSDNLVITHFLGAGEVTPYSIGFRLTGYASLLQSLIVPSLWPALAESYQKGDLPWIQKNYRSINQKTLSLVAVIAFALALFGRPIIRVWAGQGAVPSSHLIWWMALFALVLAATNNQALLLNASGRLRLETIVAVVAATANLCASVYFVQRIGVDGVILSSIASFLLFMYLPQAWEVRRVLSGRYMRTKSLIP